MQHCTFCYRLFGSDLPVTHDIDVAPWGIALARVHAASPALHICPSSLCAHATEGLSKDVRQRKLQFMACSGAIARSHVAPPHMPDAERSCQLSKRAAIARHVQLLSDRQIRRGDPNKRREVVGGVPGYMLEPVFWGPRPVPAVLWIFLSYAGKPA